MRRGRWSAGSQRSGRKEKIICPEGKAVHETEEGARKHVINLLNAIRRGLLVDENIEYLNVYRCRHGEHWHVGHGRNLIKEASKKSNKRTKERRERRQRQKERNLAFGLLVNALENRLMEALLMA